MGRGYWLQGGGSLNKKKSSKKSAKKAPKKKNGVECQTCGSFVKNSDSHAAKHRKEWVKEHPNTKPIPGIRFLVWKDDIVVGRKLI